MDGVQRPVGVQMFTRAIHDAARAIEPNALATIIYIRNIMLIWKNRGSGSETLNR